MFNKNLLGLRLRILRDKLNLKQEDVADEIGCKRSTVSNLERGAKAPSIDMLILLSQFFDVGVDYLLGISDDPSPPTRPKEGIELGIVKEQTEGKYGKRGQTDKKPGQDEIDKLVEELDKESVSELKKYAEYLKIRQTLDSNKDEKSAGLDAAGDKQRKV